MSNEHSKHALRQEQEDASAKKILSACGGNDFLLCFFFKFFKFFSILFFFVTILAEDGTSCDHFPYEVKWNDYKVTTDSVPTFSFFLIRSGGF